MTAKNEATNTPTLQDTIEPTPRPADAQMMKAIIQDEYGSAPEDILRLAEIDRPAIGDGEVLVRLRAASVDRGTWHLMTGLPKLMRIMGFGFRRPKAPNPGRCLAGTVEAVSKNVTEFKPGDEVYGTCDGSFARVRHRSRVHQLRPRAGGRLSRRSTRPVRDVGREPRPEAERRLRRAGAEPGRRDPVGLGLGRPFLSEPDSVVSPSSGSTGIGS